MIKLTERQETELYKFLKKKYKFINILVGSVRSGKTYISLYIFILWVLAAPNKNYIIVGRTLKSLERNIILPMTGLFGSENVKYSINNKRIVIFGISIDLEGADNDAAFTKIQGSTYKGGYIDELTLTPRNFFEMLLTRVSEDNGFILATTNPDSPNHYIKKDYIDRADQLDLYVSNFVLTDNTFLSDRYINNMKRSFTGSFYNRFILGRWARLEGVIYNEVSRVNINLNDIANVVIGVDYGGNKSKHAFCATGFDKSMSRIFVLKSILHDGGTDSDKLLKLETDFINYIYYKYSFKKNLYVYCDSAETVLINTLKNYYKQDRFSYVKIRNASKTKIINRIRLTQFLINNDHLFLNKLGTDTLYSALTNAVWNEKKEGERLDDFTTDIDSLDAFEYTIENYTSKLLKDVRNIVLE